MRLGILDANGDARFVPWQTGPIPPPDPDPPGQFTHGSQIHRWNIGRPDGYYPEDTRTVLAAPIVRGGTTFTAADSDSVIENVRFTGNVAIRGGCDNILFRYCMFDPPYVSPGNGQYGVRNWDGGGRAYFEDCTFVGKYGRGKTILLQGSGGMWFKRCLMLGSEDIIHAGQASGPQPWPDYVADDFVGARIICEDCWIGDGARAPDGHVDCVQWDENGGDAVLRRCRLVSYSIVTPAIPRDAQGNPTLPGNGAVLLTYNQGAGQLGRFGLYDCAIDGGNFGLNLRPPDGPEPLIAAVRRCTFGAESPFMFNGDTYVGCFRYGPLLGGTHLSANTWGVTGDVLILGQGSTNPTARTVTAGQAI